MSKIKWLNLLAKGSQPQTKYLVKLKKKIEETYTEDGLEISLVLDQGIHCVGWNKNINFEVGVFTKDHYNAVWCFENFTELEKAIKECWNIIKDERENGI